MVKRLSAAIKPATVVPVLLQAVFLILIRFPAMYSFTFHRTVNGGAQ